MREIDPANSDAENSGTSHAGSEESHARSTVLYEPGTPGQARPPLPPTARLQQLMPQFEFIELLGHGGMGAVYKARQKSLDRLVAVKILPPDLFSDRAINSKERFKQEALALARLNHPSIVNVHEFGETKEGQLYIVMELVDGSNVASMLSADGRLPPGRALAIVDDVCAALQSAHEQGIIHRDIKPANVLVSASGRVKVADFGLAKVVDASAPALTKVSVTLGTPDFIAPELFQPGTSADARADIYAVGVMLYQMLTGELPRGSFAPPSVRTGCDPRLDGILNKALQNNREDRFQSVADLRDALQSVSSTPVQQSSGRGSIDVKLGMGRQSGCGANIAITVTLVLMTGTLGLVMMMERGSKPADPSVTLDQSVLMPPQMASQPSQDPAKVPAPTLPEGMYMLREKTRALHETGVKMLPAGTRLRSTGVVKDALVTVKDETGITFEVDEKLLTRNPVEIAWLDRQASDSVMQSLVQQKKLAAELVMVRHQLAMHREHLPELKRLEQKASAGVVVSAARDHYREMIERATEEIARLEKAEKELLLKTQPEP